MGWFDRLFNKHKFVRRGIVVWATVLITWVVVQVFTDLSAINGAVVSALSIVVGLLSSALIHYKWSRDRDDK